MQLNPSPQVRTLIYIIIVLGSAILAPLNVSGIISDTAMSVWVSVSGAASLLAAINVSGK